MHPLEWVEIVGVVVAALPPMAFARAIGVAAARAAGSARRRATRPRGRRAGAGHAELRAGRRPCRSGGLGGAGAQRAARRVGQPVAAGRGAVHERPRRWTTRCGTEARSADRRWSWSRAGMSQRPRVLLLNDGAREHAQLEQPRIRHTGRSRRRSPPVRATPACRSARRWWRSPRRSPSWDDGALAVARDRLEADAGEAFMIDAAAVAANFEMMTRVADGTGARFPRSGCARADRPGIGVHGRTALTRRHRRGRTVQGVRP